MKFNSSGSSFDRCSILLAFMHWVLPLHLVAGCVLSCKSCPLFTSTNFLLSCQKFLLLHNMSSLQSFVQILRTIIQILEFSCLLFCLLQFLTKKRPTYPITYIYLPIENRSNPRDLWPLRHLIRVMRRHDLTKKYLPSKNTYPPTYLLPFKNTLKKRF